jgi:predicted permease
MPVSKVLGIVFPFFSIIGIGFFAYRRRVIDKETPTALLSFVYYFLLPPFVLMKIANADFNRGFPTNDLLSYYIASGVVFTITYLTSRWLHRHDRKTVAIRSLASIASNTGYLGLPIVALAYGEQAIIPGVAIVLCDNLIVLVGGSFLLEGGADRDASYGAALLGNLGKLGRNPLIVSTVLGTLYVLIVGVIPTPIRALGQTLAEATLPCALFALGATLAKQQKVPSSKDRYELVALKVIVFPILAMLGAHYVFGLDRAHTGIVAIMALMPVSVTTFILASRYEVQVDEMSSVLFLTTCLSIVGLSGILLFLS